MYTRYCTWRISWNRMVLIFWFCIAAEIGMFDGYVVVYKFISDVHFYVTGGEDENELILAQVLQGFFDAVALLLRLHRSSSAVFLFWFSHCFWLIVKICRVDHWRFIDCGTHVNVASAAGITLIREVFWKIWILFFFALMRLWMAGMSLILYIFFKSTCLKSIAEGLKSFGRFDLCVPRALWILPASK